MEGSEFERGERIRERRGRSVIRGRLRDVEEIEERGGI
jgi:hypothetical protein